MKNTEPTTHRDLLEIERLIPRHARRVTIEDHLRFRETLDDPHRDDNDLTDLLNELREIERTHRRP